MKAEHSSKSIIAAAFLLPIGVTAGARFIGSGSQLALAEVSDLAATLPQMPDTADLESPEPPVSLESPFWSDSAGIVYVQEPAIPVETEEPHRKRTIQAPPPSIRLTAVMPSPRTPLAVINGKPCRIGDKVAASWTLVEINGSGRTVTIEAEDGRRVTIALSR